MRRREFITLIGALAAALSLATCVEPAGAQSTVPQKRLGLLSGFGCSRGALARRLAELGWIEGRTLIYDCVATTNSPDPDQLTLLATELVARRPGARGSTPSTYARVRK